MKDLFSPFEPPLTINARSQNQNQTQRQETKRPDPPSQPSLSPMSLLNPKVYGTVTPELSSARGLRYMEKLGYILFGQKGVSPASVFQRYSETAGEEGSTGDRYSMGKNKAFFYQRLAGDLLASPRYADRGLLVNYEVGVGKTATALYFVKAILLQLREQRLRNGTREDPESWEAKKEGQTVTQPDPVGRSVQRPVQKGRGLRRGGKTVAKGLSGRSAAESAGDVVLHRYPQAAGPPALVQEPWEKALSLQRTQGSDDPQAPALRDRTVMILVPNGALVENWKKEIQKFVPGATPDRFTMDPFSKDARRIELSLEDFDPSVLEKSISSLGSDPYEKTRDTETETVTLIIQNGTYVRTEQLKEHSVANGNSKKKRDEVALNFYTAFLRLSSRRNLSQSRSQLQLHAVQSLSAASVDQDASPQNCAEAVVSFFAPIRMNNFDTLVLDQAMEDRGFLRAMHTYLQEVVLNSQMFPKAETNAWHEDRRELEEKGLSLPKLQQIAGKSTEDKGLLRMTVEDHAFDTHLGTLAARKSVSRIFVPKFIIMDEVHNFVLPGENLPQREQVTLRAYKNKLESTVDLRIMALTATPMTKSTSLTSFYALANLILGPGRWLYYSPDERRDPGLRSDRLGTCLSTLATALEGTVSFVNLTNLALKDSKRYPRTELFCLPRKLQEIAVFFPAANAGSTNAAAGDAVPNPAPDLLQRRARVFQETLLSKLRTHCTAVGGLQVVSRVHGSAILPEFGREGLEIFRASDLLAQAVRYAEENKDRSLVLVLDGTPGIRNLFKALPYNVCACEVNVDFPERSTQDINASIKHLIYLAEASRFIRFGTGSNTGAHLGTLSPLTLETASTALSATTAGTYRLGLTETVTSIEFQAAKHSEVALLRPNVVYFKDGLERRDAERTTRSRRRRFGGQRGSRAEEEGETLLQLEDVTDRSPWTCPGPPPSSTEETLLEETTAEAQGAKLKKRPRGIKLSKGDQIRQHVTSRVSNVLLNILRLPRSENHLALIPRLSRLLGPGLETPGIDKFDGNNKEFLFSVVQRAAQLVQGGCVNTLQAEGEEEGNPDGTTVATLRKTKVSQLWNSFSQPLGASPGPCLFRVFNVKKFLALLLGVQIPGCCDVASYRRRTQSIQMNKGNRMALADAFAVSALGLKQKPAKQFPGQKRVVPGERQTVEEEKFVVEPDRVRAHVIGVASQLLESLNRSGSETGKGTATPVAGYRTVNVLVDSRLQEHGSRLDTASDPPPPSSSSSSSSSQYAKGLEPCKDLSKILLQGLQPLLQQNGYNAPSADFWENSLASSSSPSPLRQLEKYLWDIMVDVFNQKANMHGRFASAMFLNHEKEEGISFFHVRNFHIVFEEGHIHRSTGTAQTTMTAATKAEGEGEGGEGGEAVDVQEGFNEAWEWGERYMRRTHREVQLSNRLGSTSKTGFQENPGSQYRNRLRTNVFEPLLNIEKINMVDAVDLDAIYALSPVLGKGYSLQNKRDTESGEEGQTGHSRGLTIKGQKFEPTRRKQQIGRAMRSGSHANFDRAEDRFVRPWIYLESSKERYNPCDVLPISLQILSVIRNTAVDCPLLFDFLNPPGTKKNCSFDEGGEWMRDGVNKNGSFANEAREETGVDTSKREWEKKEEIDMEQKEEEEEQDGEYF